MAIVEDLPQTTRDRIYGDAFWEGHEFVVVDTGGLELKSESIVRQRVREQIEIAIAEADVILFLTDARGGILPSDIEVADILRCIEKPVILAANKIDNPASLSEAFQFYQLGIGDPIPISAYHGKGIDGLLDRLVAHLPSSSTVSAKSEMMKVAIVGRPNVGKSMLLNTILGEERVIVDEVPGTTRDAIDTVFCSNGSSSILIDTAGIRRRGRIENGIENYSVIRAFRAIDRADVALLVTDATEGITAQDVHILGHIRQAYCGAVLIANKWDLVEIKDLASWTKGIRQRTKFMPYIPILFTSAKTGYGVEEVIPTAKRIYHQRFKSLPPPLLENLIKKIVAFHPPPMKGGKQLNIFHATQAEVNPPTFVFCVNDAKLVHFSYQRYLENKLRQASGFEGSPLRLLFKSKGGR
jgi:GTP-binding protein